MANASNNEPKQANDGRDAGGRFTAGNKGGPGNPFARQVARLRQALLNSVTEDDIADVGKKLVGLAKDGNIQAAKLLFTHVIGKPQPAPEPDRLDVDEWEGYQQTACMKPEAAALSQVGDPEFHLNFVRNARPIITTLMQEEMRKVANETPEQKQAREDAEAEECERILNAPAPEMPGVDPRYDRPSANGNKRRAQAERPSANGEFGTHQPSPNGQKPMPHPSANGRFAD